MKTRAVLASLLLVCAPAPLPVLAATIQTLYTFTGADNSSTVPSGGLTYADGKLWGTAGGVNDGYGSIYSISPSGSGSRPPTPSPGAIIQTLTRPVA